MDVAYITVKSDKLATVPIADGQIIAISDKDAWFYDMEGARHKVSGHVVANNLPENTEQLYPDTLYIVQEGSSQGVYIWTGSKFTAVASNNTDEQVKSISTELGRSYLLGTQELLDSTGIATKHSDVYVDNQTGKLHANGFIGGAADNAISAQQADVANKAVSDDNNQNITQTYIKALKTEGTKLTLIRGDGTTESIYTQDTDTHSVTNLVFSHSPQSQTNTVAGNGDVYMNISDDSTLRSSHKIVGSGSVEVSSDASGNLTISGQNTWKPNTAGQEGYVAAGQPNSVWSTDEAGSPSWQPSHPPYVHPDSGVSSGTYTKVAVNAQGHVISGSNPNTLAGYGITDSMHFEQLPDDADLDLILTPGFYFGNKGNSILGKPDGVDEFSLRVIQSGDNKFIQTIFKPTSVIMYPDGVKRSDDEYQFTRYHQNEGFSPWIADKLTDTLYVHPTMSGYKHIPVGGEPGALLGWLSNGEAGWVHIEIPTATVMEGSTLTEAGKAGLVPAPDAGPADAYLRNDGTWAVPPNTTYTAFVGATSTTDGQSGLVPAPQSAESNMYLNSDGTWRKIDTSEYKPIWEEFTP